MEIDYPTDHRVSEMRQQIGKQPTMVLQETGAKANKWNRLGCDSGGCFLLMVIDCMWMEADVAPVWVGPDGVDTCSAHTSTCARMTDSMKSCLRS